MSNSGRYSGSCHCGAITFEVVGKPPSEAISCNCSHCRRKGFLLSAIPADTLHFTQGAGTLAEYRFHKHAIAHQFCPTCGCQPFAQGKGPDGSAMAMINLRCVPDVDLDALTIHPFDGASR